jgi:hypothetical protein
MRLAGTSWRDTTSYPPMLHPYNDRRTHAEERESKKHYNDAASELACAPDIYINV